MADLVDLLDAFDRLVAAAAEVDADAAAGAGAVASRERRRRGYRGDTVVVALAGGTGSGKSSLINALAGEEVALTGPQRPTTSVPLAWIPSNPEPGVIRLLDDMEVDERVGQEKLPWLAVIDLPDMDSVAETHRATVERLLPQVDAIVWVVDPEKYQDRLLHDEYLRPLAPHAARFRFVLNQIDRVRPEDLPALVDDLGESLRSDGIEEAVITVTAADPSIGPPMGIDEFVEDLRAMGDAKQVIHDRIVTDMAEAAARLVERLGIEGGGTGFAEDWEQTKANAASLIAGDLVGRRAASDVARAGAGVGRRATSLIRPEPPTADIPLSLPPETGPGRRAAVDMLDDRLARLSNLVEGDVRTRVRGVRSGVDAAVMDGSLAVVVASAVRPGDPPAWWGVARFVRWLGALAGLVGTLLSIDAIRADNSILVPVLLLVGGLVLTVIPRTAAARAGRRWAARGLEAVMLETEQEVARELDRRIGRPLRDALRVRAGAATAYLEFRLAMDQLDSRP